MITAAADVSRPRPPAALAAGVVPLLALAVFINYVDRGNFATVAPALKDALRLSNTQIGLMISAFFFVYAPGQLAASWAAHRFGPYRVLAIGLAIWSVATAMTSLAGGFAMLLALRVALGVGECVAFPCSSQLLARHLPGEALGAANGLICVGLALGPAAGTLVGGWLLTHWGWRASFLVFGLASLLWLWPWLRATSTKRAFAGLGRGAERSGPSFRTVLTRPAVWAAGLGQFCGNFAVYFVVSWLPLFLVKHRGFTVPQMAAFVSLVYLIYAASAFFGGRLSDVAVRAGWPARIVRKAMMAVGMSGIAICLAVCAFGDRTTTIAALLVIGLFIGMSTTMTYAIAQTMAGPAAGGKWIGLQNGIANLAGIFGPILTGWAVDATGSFNSAFLFTAAVAACGLLFWVWLLPRVEPLDWATKPALFRR